MSATIGTRIHSFLFGRYVGSDAFGNRYYEQRGQSGKQARRWVIYRGVVEPSKVPAAWHGWLHHTHDAPAQEYAQRFAWQKPHLPNLTGTQGRYLPAGHIEKAAARAPATSDYQPWTPE